MTKIQKIPNLKVSLADPRIHIIRAGIGRDRDITDPADTEITVVRLEGAGNVKTTHTRKTATALYQHLQVNGWRVAPSGNPGGLWTAKPPVKPESPVQPGAPGVKDPPLENGQPPKSSQNGLT